ncbi:hypothetical protein, partial [Mesorhizobium sp. YM1C-6-2]|uniref:hypothetical protein n=1 Tax=Mesorhizobium sp. YM1C-6-2 TaxID=1827501 RepID=UPI001AEC759A
ELNHFTVPVVMMNPFLSNIMFSRCGCTVSKNRVLREGRSQTSAGAQINKVRTSKVDEFVYMQNA